jgi:hypothetical protein
MGREEYQRLNFAANQVYNPYLKMKNVLGSFVDKKHSQFGF